MPTLRIPTPLRAYTNGVSDLNIQGTTVEEVVENLVTQYPPLRPHLFSSEGGLRPYVNLFLGDENIKELQGLQTPLAPDDRLLLIPSIAGG